jgi:hypothetical protein
MFLVAHQYSLHIHPSVRMDSHRSFVLSTSFSTTGGGKYIHIHTYIYIYILHIHTWPDVRKRPKNVYA